METQPPRNTTRSPDRLIAALDRNDFDLIGEIDARGRLCYASKSLDAIVRRSARGLPDAPPWTWIHPDDRAAMIAACETAFRSGESARVSARAPAQRHRERWIEYTISPFESEGSATHAVVLGRDVSQAKRLENRLRASCERFQRISENAYDMIAEYDLSGRLLYLNDRSHDVIGCRLEKAHGFDPNALVHPEDRARARDAFRRASSSAQDKSRVTYRVGRRDGSWCWIEAVLFSVIHADGGRRIVAIARDVSERVDAEQRLRESEERYRQLVEGSPLGLLVIQGHRIVFSNEIGAELCGSTSAESLIGTEFFDLVAAPDAEALDAQMARTRVLESEAGSLEMHLCGLDGRIRDVTVTGRAISFRGAPAYQMVVRDITELRRAGREQKRLELQLQEARKLESLGVLAGGIAHDFNNLLAVILSNARFAKSTLQDRSELDEALSDTIEAAESAARLTRQLLAYARRRTPDVRPVDLSALVRSNGAVLRFAVPKRVKLDLDLADDLPLVEADVVQLEQVVMNLVINAAEAIGSGRGAIRVATGRSEIAAEVEPDWIGAESVRPGACVFLEVRDSGIGMDPATRSRIFEPFYTSKSQGHGLGLSAVLGLVQGHRGAISIDTAPGRGTALRIHLPVTLDGPPRDTAGAGNAQWDATVLVVTDEREPDRPMTRVLREHGACVLEAPAGEEAIELLRLYRDEIDLACIDLDAAVSRGPQLCRALRALRPDLPFLLSAAAGDAALARQLALDAPAQMLITPCAEEKLVAQLGAMLGKPGANAFAASP